MRRLLVVVDYQNDFVDGALGFADAVRLEDAICGKIEEYNLDNSDIIFTFDTHFDNYLSTQEGQNLPVAHCIENTDGHKLYGKVDKLYNKDKHKSFNKHTFGSLDLANYLKDCDYTDIEFVGVVSNICVISNVVLAKSALPEARIYVDTKCTASFDPDMNKKALDIMQGLQVTLK